MTDEPRISRRTFLKAAALAPVAAAAGCTRDTPSPADIAQQEETAALEDIARALILTHPEGPLAGGKWLSELTLQNNGRRLVTIYSGTEQVDGLKALLARGHRFNIENPRTIDKKLQDWMLEGYKRQFPDMDFAMTDNLGSADLIILQTKLLPNTRRSQPLNPDEISTYKAYSFMSGAVGGKTHGVVLLNTDGNPKFGRRIANGDTKYVQAMFLNEIFNAIGVLDFQAMDRNKLKPATRKWLDEKEKAGGGIQAMDAYTITRSGGEHYDDEVKALDKIILKQLYQEEARIRGLAPQTKDRER